MALPQIDRETPQRWVHAGPLGWAAMNGAALGFGGFTRLGFWLWYTIPVGALLVASIPYGMLLFGTYGLARGGAVWLLIHRLRYDGQESGCLLAYKGLACRLAAACQVLVGISVVIAVGF